jgi:two-component system sensor histidine kinase PilS (NtrC family)
MYHERRLRLFIFARIFVTFLFFASTFFLDFKEFGAISALSATGIVRLMAFSFVFSIVSFVFSKVQRYQLFIAYLQTIWDLLFVTLLLLFTGGVTSPYSFLYLLSIMNAGVLLGRKEALYTASLCGILYGAILDLQFFGLLGFIGLGRESALQVGATHIIYNIFLNLMGFYLTAIITGHLYRIAQENEDALKKKIVNYDELDRLNKTIVLNLESGLITLTPSGQIRVFNRHAEILTGRKQDDVYDMHISSLFPQITSGIESSKIPTQYEFEFVKNSSESLILGFGVSPFFGAHGEIAGIILNFKDLTSLVKMKETIKQKDRLAAIGELSARMAHEIRNPLTAMSGAVQLLNEHGSIADSDKRLLTIILRESDRLNNLVTEFLAYARPSTPNKTFVSICKIIEDMHILVASDRKFDAIKIENLVPSNIIINADENQLKQVFINLLYNSADASSDGGKITFDATVNDNLSGVEPNSRHAVITVTDNGCGLSEDAAKHMFEPFWTTKPEGTGLGLAIIYRIIEGHSGHIILESPPQGGCRITITLPA